MPEPATIIQDSAEANAEFTFGENGCPEQRATVIFLSGA